MRRAVLAMAVLALGQGACSSKHAAEPIACPLGSTALEGECVPSLDDCDEASVPKLGGGCTRVGILTCAEGFAADGQGGCTAILPAMACAPGTRALPGDSACTHLVECTADEYGDPPGAHVLFVDSSAPGGGDGSRARPFGAFGDAYEAAVDGDTVAFAAGQYKSGAVKKALTLWGRCPQQVSFVAHAGKSAASIYLGAKVKLARVAITGDGVGLGVDGAQGVEIENVWIHDTGADGVWIQVPTTDASVSFENVLVEKAIDTGLGAYGATVTIDRTVVRDVAPGTGKTRGNCVAIEDNLARKKPGNATITRSLFERCHEAAITVFGSDAVIEKTVFRDTLPLASDRTYGNGISILSDTDLKRASTAILRDLVVSNNTTAGIFVQRSSARLERVSVVDTQPQVSDNSVGVALYGAQGGTFDVVDSFFARNHHVALLLTGDTTIERSIVRDVSPDASGLGGIGIASVPLTTDANLHLDVIDSVVAHTLVGGVVFLGTSGSVRGSHIRDVLPGTGGFGDGISAEPWAQPTFTAWVPSNVVVENTLITGASRAGALSLGDCTIAFSSTILRCNSIDIAVSPIKTPSVPPGEIGTVDDRGGTFCGCDSASRCHAQQSELTPIVLKP